MDNFPVLLIAEGILLLPFRRQPELGSQLKTQSRAAPSRRVACIAGLVESTGLSAILQIWKRTRPNGIITCDAISVRDSEETNASSIRRQCDAEQICPYQQNKAVYTLLMSRAFHAVGPASPPGSKCGLVALYWSKRAANFDLLVF